MKLKEINTVGGKTENRLNQVRKHSVCFVLSSVGLHIHFSYSFHLHTNCNNGFLGTFNFYAGLDCNELKRRENSVNRLSIKP